ncbi:hypothetical protein ACFFRR_007065 [Megaselia abdita]
MELIPIFFFISLTLEEKLIEAGRIFEHEINSGDPDRISENLVIEQEIPHYGNSEGRIVNGNRASRGQFPYQAGLSIKDNQNRYFKCGGSLISRLWILTAAHCTYGRIEATVYLGRTDLRENQPGSKVLVSRDLRNHPNYNSNTLANDIALIKLPSSVTFNQYINKVRLPMQANSYVGQTAFASGYGKTSDTTSTDYLMFITERVISNEQCSRTFSIRSSNICAQGRQGNTPQAICNGDSGGPLAISNVGQIGLVSFSIESCEKGAPDVYTRISSYKSFLESQTGLTFN